MPHGGFVIAAFALLSSGCAHLHGVQATGSPGGEVVDPREERCLAGTSAAASRDCFLAGNAYDRGAEGHALRQDKAIALFAMGCRQRPNEDPSCGALKNEVVSLQLFPPQRPRALVLLEAACTAGSLDLCNDLALAYRDALGTSAQPAKALTLFDKTCHADDPRASPTTLEAVSAACERAKELRNRAQGQSGPGHP